MLTHELAPTDGNRGNEEAQTMEEQFWGAVCDVGGGEADMAEAVVAGPREEAAVGSGSGWSHPADTHKGVPFAH